MNAVTFESGTQREWLTLQRLQIRVYVGLKRCPLAESARTDK